MEKKGDKQEKQEKGWNSPKIQLPSPKGEATYCNQPKLKPLPVPPLDHSCQLYLNSLIPLVDEKEFENSKKAVEEFAKGPVGPMLQKRLEERAKQKWREGKNWLQDWWFDWAYLKWPDPIVINSNFYEVTETPAFKIGIPQAFSAARMIYGVRKFIEFLKSEKRSPEYMGKDPLCMNQFRSLFTTARIPGENGDVLKNYVSSNDVIILCRKQMYVVPMYFDGQPLTTRDLEAQINFILEDSKKHPEPPHGLGIMTAVNRVDWAKLRQELIAHPQNAKNFQLIDESAFVLSLEDAKPVSTNETGELCIAGDANNRWFDKIVQYIVFANGRAGVNGEHSPVDAPCTEQIANYMMDQLRDLQDLEYPDFGQRISLPKPERMNWQITAKHYQVMAKAQAEYDKLRADHDLRLMRYWNYGTEWIKKAQVSPDSFIQMGLQLAIYKIHKKPVATYETGQTRLFRNGRTETVRSCSKESFAWTQSMLDPSKSKEERLKLLKEGINSHKNYMMKAVKGMACDRHLLGLRILAAEALQNKEISDMPAIFKDPAYARSTTYLLSTSSMGNSEGYYVGGFGCFLPGSVGVCYQPWDNSMHFSIVTRRSGKGPSSELFEKVLGESFDEIKALFEAPAKL